ncbi:MAG: C40 family peptidase [Oscillospiraceae bacterium]|nr:C40 family peptidase [Oscillospiraceae bacterium]
MKNCAQRFRRLLCLALCLTTVFITAMPSTAIVAQPDLQAAASAAQTVQLPTTQSVVQEPQEQNAAQKAVEVQLKPWAAAPGIGHYEDGRELSVLGTSGDYYQVDCYGMTGYIHKDLVRVDETGRVFAQHVEGDGHTKEFDTMSLSEVILLRSDIYNVAMKQRGIRYLLGGCSRKGFDCCGLLNYIFHSCGKYIPWSVESQLAGGMIIPKESLQCGDMVFFHRTNHPTYYVTHVGVYLGDGKFLHASNSGVVVASLEEGYFAQRFLCARRYLLADAVDAVAPTQAANAKELSFLPDWLLKREIWND